MFRCLLVLIAFLISVTDWVQVDAINCTAGASTDASTTSTTGCNACGTYFYYSGSTLLWNKQCLSVCIAGTISFTPASTAYTSTLMCCTTDNCNSATTISGISCYTGTYTNLLTSSLQTAAVQQPGCTYCQKVYSSTGSLSTWTKSCRDTCITAGTSIAGVSAGTTCCQTSLCNAATKMGQVSMIVPALSAMAVVALGMFFTRQ